MPGVPKGTPGICAFAAGAAFARLGFCVFEPGAGGRAGYCPLPMAGDGRQKPKRSESRLSAAAGDVFFFYGPFFAGLCLGGRGVRTLLPPVMFLAVLYGPFYIGVPNGNALNDGRCTVYRNVVHLPANALAVETYACERGLIVVMPSAYNSYYGKWPRAFGGLEAADYFTEELMPLIYAWLPASQAREDNFIAGLSMGGQGAIKFCAGHPEKFAACAMLSAAALDYEELYRAEQQGPDHAHADYVDANGGIEKFMAGEENTRGVLRDLGASGRVGELPPIYMEAGDRDHHFQEFEAFAGFMKELGIPVRLNISEGYGHEWRFWDIGIQHALDFFEGISPKLGAERKGRD